MKRTIYIAVSILAIAVFIAVVGFHASWESRDGKAHEYVIASAADLDSLDICPIARLALTDIRPGYYRFEARMPYRHLIRMLRHGRQVDYRLVLSSNLRTLPDVAGYIGQHMQTDSTSLQTALRQHVDTTDWTEQTAICLFIPNTYFVHWTDPADQVIARMEREYQRFWNAERRARADSLGYSPTEVMTLASIVSCETTRRAEWPKIASLYLNRLRKGMPLQADPTAVYASGDFTTQRVGPEHIQTESAYNTYRHAGLPPGPIRCTDPAAIDSVLWAPKTNYLYMCANPDWSGTHVFTTNFSDHRRVASAFRHELNRRNIQSR